MKFTEILEKLQKENPGIVILVKNGIFFVATGKDAVILNKELGLKVTCMKERLCKVGFLVKSVEKYITVMKEKEMSFAIYIINKETNEPEQIFKNIGKNTEESRQCLDCSNCNQKKETEDEILDRLKKLNC